MKALIFNATLKNSTSDQPSNTGALIDKVVAEYKDLHVTTEVIRLADYHLALGTSTETGDPNDQWPELIQKIKQADIFLIATPVWMGHVSSLVQQTIERLDAIFHEDEHTDPKTGQYWTYNKIGGAVATGNEDGAKQSCFFIISRLINLGFTVPPNGYTYWVGPAGPGPSYIKAGGQNHLYTNKTYRQMVHNSHKLATALKQNPIDTNLNEIYKQAKSDSDQ